MTCATCDSTTLTYYATCVSATGYAKSPLYYSINLIWTFGLARMLEIWQKSVRISSSDNVHTLGWGGARAPSWMYPTENFLLYHSNEGKTAVTGNQSFLGSQLWLEFESFLGSQHWSEFDYNFWRLISSFIWRIIWNSRIWQCDKWSTIFRSWNENFRSLKQLKTNMI